jgi:hypothetical protein
MMCPTAADAAAHDDSMLAGMRRERPGSCGAMCSSMLLQVAEPSIWDVVAVQRYTAAAIILHRHCSHGWLGPSRFSATELCCEKHNHVPKACTAGWRTARLQATAWW